MECQYSLVLTMKPSTYPLSLVLSFLVPFSTWVDDSLIFFSVTVDLLNITLGGSAQETIEYRTSVNEKK